MNDSELSKKAQGRIGSKEKDRITFLLKEGFFVSESDMVRHGLRLVWQEYQAGALVKPEPKQEETEPVEA